MTLRVVDTTEDKELLAAWEVEPRLRTWLDWVWRGKCTYGDC